MLSKFHTRSAVVGVAVLATAGIALAPSGGAAAAPTARSSTLHLVVGKQTVRRGPSFDLAGVKALHRRGSHSAGTLTRIPGEHYIVTDPDNNSVFSPGGKGAGSAKLPTAVGNRVVSPAPTAGTVGFVGLTGADQASVNGGGDLEPPDQGLCTDGSTILEYVNNALEAYSPRGNVLAGPIGSPSLYGLDPSTFMADPRCYYDAPTRRWFLTEFDLGTTNDNGGEVTPSVQYIAVSNTPDPLGSYHTYSIDTTDATVSGCPCFGDFDQIGADANGFYLSTNEFGLSSGAYNGAIIYAIDKNGLEHAADLGASTPTMITYRLLNDAFGQPYHVAPSQTPPGSSYPPNREYFVESNSNAAADDHLLVYTLQNTRALTTGGVPVLSSTEITSEKYAFPPAANQRPGALPLGGSVNERKGALQADFNAIQEVTYAGGSLYAELDTAAAGGKDGVAWFIIKPTPDGATTTARVSHQGYVTAPGLNLLYPDIAVDQSGHGYLLFSMTGAHMFPSAANVAFGPTGPSGAIRTAKAGASPEDGFTCYAAFVGSGYGGCRWGDYSMGVAAAGRIFMATEFIASTPRDFYTNWATFVWSAPRPS